MALYVNQGGKYVPIGDVSDTLDVDSSDWLEEDLSSLERGDPVSRTMGDDVVKPGELTLYIRNNIQKLQDLSTKVGEALKAGKNAESTASKAKDVKATFSIWESKEKQQDLIRAMQETDSQLARAVSAVTKAEEAQFHFQEEMSKIIKGLFLLGCGSLAQNRVVVSELEARLRGASKAELDDMARRELQNLMLQLDQQGDLLQRQADLGKNQDEFEQRLTKLEDAVREQIEKLDSLRELHGSFHELHELVQNFIAFTKENIEAKIYANEGLIEANRTQIDKNAASISVLEQARDALAKAEDDNKEQIKANTKKISDNSLAVSRNAAAIEDNTKLITTVKMVLKAHRHELAIGKTCNGFGKWALGLSVLSVLMAVVALVMIGLGALSLLK